MSVVWDIYNRLMLKAIRTPVKMVFEQAVEREKEKNNKVMVQAQLNAVEMLIKTKNAGGGCEPKWLERTIGTEEAFECFKAAYPKAYAEYERCFAKGLKEYTNDMRNNCIVAGNRFESAFNGFLSVFLNGYVLDIGCGPQAVPIYLADYPPDLVFGLDPLPPFEPHPFRFFQGVCEYLPWQDEQFDTVTAVTSLDHVFDLDRALSEVSRVLKPDGVFAVWVADVDGAKEYQLNEGIKAIDEYHLFHFSMDWAENRFKKAF